MKIRQLFKAVWRSILMLATVIMFVIGVLYAITFLPDWLTLTISGIALFALIVFLNYKSM